MTNSRSRKTRDCENMSEEELIDQLREEKERYERTFLKTKRAKGRSTQEHNRKLIEEGGTMTGNELKEMRQELGLKQDQMAVYMGISTRRIAGNEQRQEGSIPKKLEEEVLQFYENQKQGGK